MIRSYDLPIRRRVVAAFITLAAVACAAGASAQTQAPRSPQAASAPGDAVQPQAASESSIAFGRFGTVAVCAPARPPRQVVLFVSGDGGWNLGLVDMARRLAALGVWWAGVRWVVSPLAT
jgi:type IV secretory pathway VirJ component